MPFVVLTALIVVVSELLLDLHAAVMTLNLSKAKYHLLAALMRITVKPAEATFLINNALFF